jgi:hypothetical protein
MKRQANVHGRDYEVTVRQETPSVWTASGTYMDEWHEAKGWTESGAISQWRDWARLKGNSPTALK